MTEQKMKEIEAELEATKATLEDIQSEVWLEYAVKKLKHKAEARDRAIADYEHCAVTLRHMLSISKPEESFWAQVRNWIKSFGK